MITYSQHGDVDAAYIILTSFEFILILNLMKEFMGTTDPPLQALQQNFQQLVHITKVFDSKVERLLLVGFIENSYIVL